MSSQEQNKRARRARGSPWLGRNSSVESVSSLQQLSCCAQFSLSLSHLRESQPHHCTPSTAGRSPHLRSSIAARPTPIPCIYIYVYIYSRECVRVYVAYSIAPGICRRGSHSLARLSLYMCVLYRYIYIASAKEGKVAGDIPRLR